MFAVKVVRVERADGFKGLLVLLVCKVRVCAFAMPSNLRWMELAGMRQTEVFQRSLTGRSCGTESSRDPPLVAKIGP